MSTAHPKKFTGKRSPKLAASVAVGDFLLRDATGALPAHPVTDPVPPLTYPMDKNDVAGVCVVAGVDHTLQTICAVLGVPRKNWTTAQILKLYQTQNPGFTSWSQGGTDADGGMDIQTFLEHLVSTGDIVAFGRLDHTNQELLKAAAYVGLAVVTGELLTRANMSQQTWDYVPNDTQEGGHCTTTVAYDPALEDVVSWGSVYPITPAFISHQLDEAWFVLTEAHLTHPGFRDSFDLAGFSTAVSELTGGKVVVPVPEPPPQPPAPVPTPVPTPPGPPPVPVPVDPLADFPVALMDRWAHSPFGWGATADASHAYREWRRAHPGKL